MEIFLDSELEDGSGTEIKFISLSHPGKVD